MSVGFPSPEHGTVANLEVGQAQCDAVPEVPPVSIVITTYNHARFLAEAIESALNQTTPPYEVIVVDDGSIDNPESVVDRYPQLQLISQSNQGPSAARNTGWRAARGRYVVFLDADDRLLPQALVSNLQRFEERPECAFVYGGFTYVDATGKQQGSPPVAFVGEDPYETFLKGNCVTMNAAVLYRRDCLEEVGGFDERLRCAEDYDLYLRLARRHGVNAGIDCIAEYRRHDDNKTLNIPFVLDMTLKVMRKQQHFIEHNIQWKNALKTGIRNSKSIYARAQLSQVRAVARAAGVYYIPWGSIARVVALAPGTVVGACQRFILKTIRNSITPTRVGSVKFGHLRRLRPISANFGYDRGKPVDRYYIEAFLCRNAEDFKGRVLEIGDNTYSVQYGRDRATSSDILHADANNPRATLVGDLADGHNFPSQAFDCIVLTQTLNFIFDMQKAVATLHRMLKPDGVLLVTVPGISSIDREPNWPPLWTLSPTALRRLLTAEFGEANVSVTGYGNVLAAVAFLHGLAEGELQPTELDTHDPQYPVTVAARAVRRDQKSC